jgi:hypothetical protein
MLKITEAGRIKVASPQFAEEVRGFIRTWRTSGKSEAEGKRMVITRIALELASHNGIVPEREEFSRFLDENVAEINAAASTMLANAMISDSKDTNGSVN